MSGIMSNVAALVVCVVVTMGLRWLSLRFDIKSPTEEDIARFLHRKNRWRGPILRNATERFF